MSDPRLSVLIVSHDSQRDLARLLPTIPGGGVQVVVVDNHGEDGVAGWLAAQHPDVVVVPAGANLGYAGGNNAGLAAAHGDRVLVLNPDTELAAGAIEALHAALDDAPDALVTPKVVDPAGRVYACGLEAHYTGITSRRSAGDDPARHTGTFQVPIVSGTAFAAARSTLAGLGPFDEWYWMYLEDVDLSVRARDSGRPILCAGDAVVVHHTDPAISAFQFQWLERNRWPMLRKLNSRSQFRRLLPALVVTEAAVWAFALLRGPRFVSAKVRAYRAMRRPDVPRSDAGWMTGTTTRLPFGQLVGRNAIARVLDAMTGWLYSLLRPGG